jgi:hypothetical protein
MISAFGTPILLHYERDGSTLNTLERCLEGLRPLWNRSSETMNTRRHP